MIGKLVRGALYVHRDAIVMLPNDARAMVEKAVLMANPVRWTVARLEKRVVGLLEYEDFDAAAFPRLIASTRVDLATGKIGSTDFSRSTNPLILHRKERLVAATDRRVDRWSETTRMLVERGLFEDSQTIGRRSAWSRRLAQAGLAAIGDEVVPA